jgi:LuxR family transcriptional regulator, maltose regulon positive regulatory protein
MLAEALRLAEPGSLLRLFADLGEKMGGLLRRFVAARGGNEFPQRILATFGDALPVQPSAGVPPARQPRTVASQSDISGVLEPLSRRELDVLLLLSARLTDKEIARELFVSPQTVKRHASNIYQKLDVGNRRDAVAKAISFGLLPVPAANRRSPERRAPLSR